MKVAQKPAASESQPNSLQIPILDGNALKKLSTEPNSSKFAIDAHNRAIQEIRDLSELPKLCSLDVSFNRLTSLKNLHTTKELRELKVYNNKITTLRGLRGNGNLEGLLVHENQIEEIAEDVLSLVKLKTLWLNGNRISKVQHLTACRLLVHLDLSRNRLSRVAAEGLDSLSSLEYLNLSGNQLTAIGNLTHLTKLEELNLANNQLSTLEGGLLPANISVLRLNDNKLTSLQSFPPYLIKLNELYLQDNAIADLGENGAIVTKFPELESLDLRNNRIRSTAQLKMSLAGCGTLMDLWIQGNPCCVSSTYLLDVITALPELRTLDNVTDTQLKSHTEALKSGTISQDALLTFMARPMTPSMVGARPGSASSRPGSASYRPLTPSSSSRQSTPDRNGAPVFHKPSARAGTLLKVASPDELEKAHADVADRLEKMKAMIRRVGKGDDKSGAAVAKKSQCQKPTERSAFRSSGPTASKVEASTHQPRAEDNQSRSASVEAAKAVKPKRGGDAGTDPLDSLMGDGGGGGARPASARVVMTPETVTPRRGMETQTPREPVVSLPPAPLSTTRSPSTVSLNRSTDVSSATDNQDAETENQDTQQEEAQLDGATIEMQMKRILLQYVSSESDKLTEEPQDEADDNGDVTESPRIESSKTAEQRLPPNPRSRQGYRSFRIPARLRDSANDGDAVAV